MIHRDNIDNLSLLCRFSCSFFRGTRGRDRAAAGRSPPPSEISKVSTPGKTRRLLSQRRRSYNKRSYLRSLSFSSRRPPTVQGCLVGRAFVLAHISILSYRAGPKLVWGPFFCHMTLLQLAAWHSKWGSGSMGSESNPLFFYKYCEIMIFIKPNKLYLLF